MIVKSSTTRWKWFAFRGLAIILGLAPFLVLEIALRLADAGKVTDGNDPFIGFSEIHPLFVLNDEADRFEIAKSRLTHFRPDSFAAKKAANEFRIFVLGGSTVQGRPWSIETSFTTWLELSLNAADASRTYEVVNCGGVSYASYRLVPILQEVLRYEPDLIIFCEGNNEFLEDRSYAPLREQPPALVWLEKQAMHLRTYNWFRAGVLTVRGVDTKPQQVLGPEVDARLDWQDGLAEYHRNDQWRADVVQHFEFNLRRIVAICDQAQMPLLLVGPVANLEWAPFKSEHREGLSPEQLAEFDRLVAEATELAAHDGSAAIGKLQTAAAIDPDYASVHYDLGLTLLEAGRRNEAEQELRKAIELDVCPLRILESLKEITRRVATETDTPLVDADDFIAGLSRNGFPDRQWLIDHCHPTIEGHQRIADAIADQLVAQRLVRPGKDWQTKKDQTYRAHLASLSHVYFDRARARLKSEQGWAHGEVKKMKPTQPRPMP